MVCIAFLLLRYLAAIAEHGTRVHLGFAGDISY
jgi:hypothetical protein